MPTLKISSCTVLLLDGSETIIEVEKLHKSSDLLDEVYHLVGIKEGSYFGLQYQHPKDSRMSWFDVQKPLQRQIKKASNKFKLCVKFFPSNIQMLQEELTRYQFVLQIRDNLLNGVWSCSTPTQALLASYVIQAEFGDYEEQLHGEDYLSGFQFIPNQSNDFLEKVQIFHKKHNGLDASTADWMYLETARKIILYGMQVFDVLDGDGNSLQLAVDINGVHVIHMRAILHHFFWPSVAKVSIHAKEIVFDTVYHLSASGEAQVMSISFMCPSLTEKKRIVRFCNAYKKFSYHGKPSTYKAKKSVALKKKKENSNAGPCSHVNVTTKEFKRVGSKQFSKRKQTTVGEVNEAVVDLQGSSEVSMGAAREKSEIRSTAKNDQPSIPIITETLASPDGSSEKNGTGHNDVGNTASALKENVYIGDDAREQTGVRNIVKKKAEELLPVEGVDSEIPAVVNNDEHDGPTFSVVAEKPESDCESLSDEAVVITEDDIPYFESDETYEEEGEEVTENEEASDHEKIEIFDTPCDNATDDVAGDATDDVADNRKDDPVETAYDVDNDEEVVVIDFNDEGELFVEGEEGGSLLDEIQRELRHENPR